MNAVTFMLSTVAFALGLCFGSAAGWMIGYSIHMVCIRAKMLWTDHKEKKARTDER